MFVNTPKGRQQWILDLLKSEPDLPFSEVFSKHANEFSKSERTFSKDWKATKDDQKEYRMKAFKVKEEASLQMEVKAIQSGLKSRFDRVMFYQRQIDIMESQLIGEEKIYFIVNNKPIVNPNSRGEYVLPIEKQNEIRKQIKEYQIEISKIEGDYEKHNEQKKPDQFVGMAKVKMIINEHKSND